MYFLSMAWITKQTNKIHLLQKKCSKHSHPIRCLRCKEKNNVTQDMHLSQIIYYHSGGKGRDLITHTKTPLS